MMRRPIRQPKRRKPVTLRNIAAPIKGWSLAARSRQVGVEYAFEMQNFIPEIGKVTLRRGSNSHATGAGAAVETLMEYSFGGTSKLFAAADGEIYDVSSAGAFPSAAVTSLTNDRWQHAMFATTGGNFLVCVNGADGVRTYDGSSWATQTITGATAANLIHITSHKARLWFVEKDTLSAWYLAVGAISGAATELDLGAIFVRGGSLAAIESWSRDGGDGMDDVLVFATTEGEVAIYQGTDPSSASTWSLVGVYQIDPPIGRRCLVNVGADVAILTESGVYPLSQVLSASSPQQVIPDEVRDAFTAAADQRRSVFGWQLCNYKRRGWVIVNVPLADGTRQYVLNMVTRRWFEITGWPAQCFGTFGGDLYFGTSTAVIQGDTGTSDDGAAIPARLMTGWDDFGTPALKKFEMIRPLVSATDTVAVFIGIRVDYDLSEFTTQAILSSGNEGAVWDAEDWDVAAWSSNEIPRNVWRGVNRVGSVASLIFETRTKDLALSLSGFDLTHESGGVL